MNGSRITNVSNGTNPSEALTKTGVTNRYLGLSTRLD